MKKKLLILTFLLIGLLHADIFAQVSQEEFDALKAIYESTNGSGWKNKNGWKNISIATKDDVDKTWTGLSIANNHVYMMALSQNKLSGKLPAEIGNFPQLRYLFLSGNSLSDTIPAEIGNLSSLQVLNLDQNEFSGEIPEEIGNLSELQSLYLFSNELTGSIPTNLQKLTKLQAFDANNNNLTGSIPSEIGNMISLTSLILYSNSISGTIPDEIVNLSSLEYLSLGHNNFSGELPENIVSITSLTELTLNHNNFAGKIPASYGNLTNLQVLDLNDNALSDTIPATIGQMTALAKLALYNNQLEGEIPGEIGNLVNLKTLLFHNNQLSGDLPVEITKIQALTTINISQNMIDSLPDFSGLNIPDNLDVSDNYLCFDQLETNSSIFNDSTQYCPQTFDFSVDPQTITLHPESSLILSVNIPGTNNHYEWYRDSEVAPGTTDSNILTFNSITKEQSGVYECYVTNTLLPGLTLVSYTSEINVKGLPLSEIDALKTFYESLDGDNWTENTNWLSEADYATWKGITITDDYITGINLDNNNLTGNFPSCITVFKKLDTLILNNNSISGELPSNTGSLPELLYIDLGNNMLSDSVPDEWTEILKLKILLLDSNRFDYLPDFSTVSFESEGLNVSDNSLTFESLEPNRLHFSTTDQYSPQSPVAISPEFMYVNANETLVLTFNVGGQSNQYQWFKQNNETDVSVTQVTDSHVFTFGNFLKSDTGNYFCKVSNTVINGLTIESETISLYLNHAPELITSDSLLATGSEIFTSNIVFTDIDNHDISVTCLLYPAWLTITYNGQTIQAKGTPSEDNIRTDTLVVQATDGIISNPIVEKITITVAKKNYAPTEILLSNSEIAEDQSVGTVIGTLSTVDPDEDDTHIYIFNNFGGDNDNDKFRIEYDLLILNKLVDYETQTTCTIYLKTMDNGGLSFTQELIINVIDAIETKIAETPANRYNVYPNPASTVITIECTSNIQPDTYHRVSITNITGKVIYCSQLTGEFNRIDISKYPKGMYLITIKKDKSLTTKRLIIE